MPTPTSHNRGYPQPHPDNTLVTDVARIKQAFEMVDQDITAIDNRQTSQSADLNDKLRKVRLNSLLNENLFVI